jgi:hypothetical protein
MKAIRIFHKKDIYTARNLERIPFRVAVEIEVFKIPPPNDRDYPEGLKVSMIAFRQDNPETKLLLNCHPPKGPHIHINELEEPFLWTGLEAAFDIFWNRVESIFGKLTELSENETEDR